MRCKSYAPGFTLVELMISIAIALLLVLGVNTIFKITSQAVGAGESVLATSRDARTVLQTLLADLSYVDPCPFGGSGTGDAPCFIINSQHIGAYRNSTDYQAATDQTNPYHDDLLFVNLNVSHQAPETFTNLRSHRVDRVGFFARTLFARQTSSDGITYVAPSVGNNGQVQAGSEAWVVYGHSQQPNRTVVNGTNNMDWRDPGAGTNATNDFNFYASDWMLTRMALILNPSPNGDYLLDDYALGPISQTSVSAKSVTLPSAALDVAGPISITAYGAMTYLNTASPPVATARTNGIWSYGYNSLTGAAFTNNGNNWWSPLLNYRFQVGPYMLYTPGTTPNSTNPKISPYGLAKCAPNLIRGCSQFIVEFAGSYYTKNPDGTPVDTTVTDSANVVHHVPVPDGQVDFVVIDPLTGKPPVGGAVGVRQVRWYGFPRTVVSPALSGSGYFDTPMNPEIGDVVPLRDVLAHLGASLPTPQSTWATYCDAERFSSTFPAASTSTTYTNYASLSTMDPSIDQNSTNAQSNTLTYGPNYTYFAAWGPDVRNTRFPKMIRIIIGIDDHEGRLNQPQSYEYVYQLQP